MKENRDSTGWSKEKIEERFAAFVKAKGRLPVAREMNPQCELPTRRTFEQHMGMTAQEYAKQNYPELLSLQNDHHIQSVLAYRQEVREWTVERLVEAENSFSRRMAVFRSHTNIRRGMASPCTRYSANLPGRHLNRHWKWNFGTHRYHPHPA